MVVLTVWRCCSWSLANRVCDDGGNGGGRSWLRAVIHVSLKSDEMIVNVYFPRVFIVNVYYFPRVFIEIVDVPRK